MCPTLLHELTSFDLALALFKEKNPACVDGSKANVFYSFSTISFCECFDNPEHDFFISIIANASSAQT